MNEIKSNYLDCLAKRENIEAVGVYHIRGMLFLFLTGSILAIFILSIEKFIKSFLNKFSKKLL
jgi:hypothetical protein